MGPLLSNGSILIRVEAVLFDSLPVDVTGLAGKTLRLLREQQENGNRASMCLRKRSLCKLYSTGLMAELRVTKTMLVVWTEE